MAESDGWVDAEGMRGGGEVTRFAEPHHIIPMVFSDGQVGKEGSPRNKLEDR